MKWAHTYIHTYIYTHTHTFSRTVSAEGLCECGGVGDVVGWVLFRHQGNHWAICHLKKMIFKISYHCTKCPAARLYPNHTKQKWNVFTTLVKVFYSLFYFVAKCNINRYDKGDIVSTGWIWAKTVAAILPTTVCWMNWPAIRTLIQINEMSFFQQHTKPHGIYVELRQQGTW